MYLTDYREYSLKDVITKLEPALFKKVTGLNLEDFELLVSLNVFNEALMNDAVYKFKRYEDASLSYAGIDKHEGESVGLFNTVLSRSDYDMMAGQLASSMVASEQDLNDLPDFSVILSSDDSEEETNTDTQTSNEYKIRPPLVSEKLVLNGSKTVTPNSKLKVEVESRGLVVGEKVKHKAFGIGTVIKCSGHTIVVEFSKNVQKKFAFPGAFHDGFLSFI